MSTYEITTPVNGTISVASGLINTTQCSLKLVGRGAAGYGAAIAENTINQLTNFASNTAPSHPLKGQLWWDSTNKTLRAYVDSTTGWTEIATGSTALTSNYVTRTELFGANSTSTTPLVTSRGGTGLTTVGTNGQVLASNGTSLYWASPVVTISGAVWSNLIPSTTNTIDLGDATHVFNDVYATNFQGTATSAKYADVAERYEIDKPAEAGDVVALGGEKEITVSYIRGSKSVLGVISSNPAFKMNSDAGDDSTHPYVALLGRVPVKVIGPVKKGQRLISSGTPGVACAADLEGLCPFSVIGRSLVNKTSDGIELIEAVLGAK